MCSKNSQCLSVQRSCKGVPVKTKQKVAWADRPSSMTPVNRMAICDPSRYAIVESETNTSKFILSNSTLSNNNTTSIRKMAQTRAGGPYVGGKTSWPGKNRTKTWEPTPGDKEYEVAAAEDDENLDDNVNENGNKELDDLLDHILSAADDETETGPFITYYLEILANSPFLGPVDVERQCGVIIKENVQCARSLTCKSHSMGAKRAVPGRSLPYDMLLAAYQKKNQAKQQSKLPPHF